MIKKIKQILGIGKKEETNAVQSEVAVPASKIPPTEKTFVVIGASAAGVDAVKTLRK